MQVLTGWDSDDGVSDLFTKVGLSGLLHLSQDHGTNFLWGEFTSLSTVLDRDGGFSVPLYNLEWPMFDVPFDIGVVHLATNETFGVKDSVGRIGVEGVLGAVTNTT